MAWSARQYTKFEDERNRPIRDLLAQLPRTGVKTAIDLGCGPGNSTEMLAAHLPDAAVTGLDSSADMIAAAKKRLPTHGFELADIATWAHGDAGAKYDLIFANAALQWVPAHENLLPALLSRLRVGGTIASQMPDNLDEPAHVLMREIAAETPFAAKLSSAAGARAARRSAEWYYQILRTCGASADVWRTTYHHPLAGGASAVVEWFKGTGLLPFLEPLDAGERAELLTRYEARVKVAYPALADGTVILPFPRLFFVARK